MNETMPAPESANTQCKLCQATFATEELKIVNGQEVCPGCLAQLESEVAAQAVTPRAFPLALIGGGLGALVAAAIWAGIGISTGYEVGYVAILVGYLAGKGVIILNPKQRGRPLQWAAVLASLGGLILAKLLILDYFIAVEITKQGTETSPFSFAAIITSIIAFPFALSFFDILWVYLAFQVAWGIPQATKLQLSEAPAPVA